MLFPRLAPPPSYYSDSMDMNKLVNILLYFQSPLPRAVTMATKELRPPPLSPTIPPPLPQPPKKSSRDFNSTEGGKTCFSYPLPQYRALPIPMLLDGRSNRCMDGRQYASNDL